MDRYYSFHSNFFRGLRQKENQDHLISDRDGVINEDQEDYVKSWEEFRFIKGVRKALKEIHQAGVPVVVITNQSIIGRGMVTEAELSVIHGRMLKGVKKAGGEILKVNYCPHHPDVHCQCRKPRIGMLKKAARELNLDLKKGLFVGDTIKDIQAGNRAGCRAVPSCFKPVKGRNR